jgi:hypothetical protein
MMVSKTFLNQRYQGLTLDMFGEGKAVGVNLPVAHKLGGRFGIAWDRLS